MEKLDLVRLYRGGSGKTMSRSAINAMLSSGRQVLVEQSAPILVRRIDPVAPDNGFEHFPFSS